MQLTMQVDMFGLILQSEQSRKEDRDQLLKELEHIKADSGAISMSQAVHCISPCSLFSSGSAYGKGGEIGSRIDKCPPDHSPQD